MNIFAVDYDPVVAARSLCDKHIVKMPLETAQILCTVSHHYEVPAPYRPTHKNHPVVRWAGETFGNWIWTVRHGLGLCREYTERYGRKHACEAIIDWILQHGGRPTAPNQTPFIQAMPDQYKRENSIEAYRAYYLGSKSTIATWKLKHSIPAWWQLSADVYDRSVK